MTDKQTSIEDAIRDWVRPGMSLHFAFTHNRAHALAFEVARRYRESGALKLVGTGLLDYGIVLAAAGALSSVECAFGGMTYPAPAPSPSIQQLVAGEQSDPNWTNLTLTLRLMAGALGIPAIPTRSLTGSDLEYGPSRALVANPFGGSDLQLVAALRPDVAFVHVPIADHEGNCRVEGPYGEELWGAWAAETVVVSAEKVVTPSEFRRMGPGPGLPAGRVDAVVEVPFGAHPQAQYVWDPRIPVASYSEDYAFRRDLRRSDRNATDRERWLDEWIFSVDRNDYVGKLGSERLEALLSKREDREAGTIEGTIPPSPQERAATVAMRTVHTYMLKHKKVSLFAGIGLSHLAAWAASKLYQPGENNALVAETGMVGFIPSPGDPYLFNYANTRSATIHDGFLKMLGCVPGGRAGRSLALLAAGQVDKSGAVNSSRSSDNTFIVGSGGANDIGSRSADVLLVMPISKGRTPNSVDFTTTRARHLIGLASDVGLMELDDQGELILTQILAAPDEVQTRVLEARSRCGWPLRTARDLICLSGPTNEELQVLRSFDPSRALLG